MAALLAFVRGRTKTKQQAASGDAFCDTSVESQASEELAGVSSVSPGHMVDRRIVRDIAGFLDALPSATHEPTGLRPPRRSPRKPLSTIDIRTTTKDQPDGIQSPSPPTSACNDGSRPPLSKNPSSAHTGTSSTSSMTPESSPGDTSRRRRVLSRFSRQMTSVSTWATFGKNTDVDVPGDVPGNRTSVPPSAWNNYVGSTESVALRRSSSSKRHSRSNNHSSTSLHHGPSRISSDRRHAASRLSTPPTKHDDHYDLDEYDVQQLDTALNNLPRLHSSRTSHSRSRSHSRPRSVSRSHSTRSRSQSLYHSAPATPPEPAFGTPYTFGAPSPLAGNTSRFVSASPPPLPPLRHPELLSSLSSRSQLDVSNTFGNTQHPPASPTWTATLHASTYPRRHRGKTTSDIRAAASTPALALPKLRRLNSASPPRVHRLFRIASVDRLWRGSTSSLRRRASNEWVTASVTQTALLPSDFRASDFDGTRARRPLSRETSGRRSEETGETDRTERLQGRSGDAEPHGTQARMQRDTPSCSSPPRLIPTSLNPPFLQSPPAQEAAEGPGSHDPLLFMDTLHSRNGSATDTLQRSASAHAERVGSRHSKRAPSRSNPSPVPSYLRPQESSSSSSSSAAPATPSTRTKSALRTPRSGTEPTLNPVPETPTNTKGKRKAEELDVTPPDQKTGHHATFVIPPEARRSHRSSEVSGAPSSYHRKRARLSTSTPQGSPAQSRPTSSHQPSPDHNASWSRRSAQNLFRTSSRASRAQSAMSGRRPDSYVGRRSIDASEQSIPISALVMPHAPSVARSSQYHMHDPRRPPKIHPTEWALHMHSEDEDASPLHAWAFFAGFILFPLWWLAAFWPIPRTRRVGDTDAEKAVTLDDPQVEHDARTWRNRCRVMSGIAFLTYIPFIILVAIFVPRHV